MPKTYKSFKECFNDNFNRKFRVGVLEKEYLKSSDYTHTKQFYRGVASKTGWGIYKDKNGNTVTTASSFVNVNNKIKFVERFKKSKAKIISVLKLLTKKGKDKSILNGLANIMKNSYDEDSKRFHNSKSKINQKGFDRYGVGTGQTLGAIKAEEVAKK